MVLKLGEKLKEAISKEMDPVVLYENSSGSASEITLNDSVTNFKYIEIFYTYGSGNNYGWESTKIFNPNNKIISTTMSALSNGNYYMATSLWQISDNTITWASGERWRFVPSTVTIARTENVKGIYIKRVIGYK